MGLPSPSHAAIIARDRNFIARQGMRDGRKAKPTALHRLHGTIRTPHRHRPPDAVAPGSLTEAPADLTPPEVAHWRFVIENQPSGVLANVDGNLLRILAQTLACYDQIKAQQDELNARGTLPHLLRNREGDLLASPYFNMLVKLRAQIARYSELLGLCPSARVGLGEADSEDSSNRWVQLEELRRKTANRA